MTADAPSTVTVDPLEQVCTWFAEGRTETEIQEAIDKFWPRRSTKKLMLEALDRFTRYANSDPDQIKGWAINATAHLYKKMVEIGDYGGALKAIKQLNELAK